MTEEQKPASARIEEFASKFRAVTDAVAGTIVGHEEVIRGLAAALFAGGHVLIEGVPGTGKTMLAKSLAAAAGGEFSRIQFTPDLMPADVIGTNVIAEEGGKRSFEFRRGPIFGNVILADEINRATPKTQSALLEAMAERSVTSGGTTHTLDGPFMVVATQNPIEMEGTYPLPEAQLDRFLFKLRIAHIGLDRMKEIVERTTGGAEPVFSSAVKPEEVVEMKKLAREVPVASVVTEYAAKLVLATHPAGEHSHAESAKYVRLGASPRAAQALILGAKVLALADGRPNPSIGDVRALAADAMRHRLLLNFEAEAEGITTDRIIEKILTDVKK